MTWPTKIQWKIQLQRQRKWQRQWQIQSQRLVTFETFDQSDELIMRGHDLTNKNRMTKTNTKTMTIPETCDIWDTNYNSDNWEPEFMTIFVAWQLIVTLDSISNFCDVFSIKLGLFLKVFSSQLGLVKYFLFSLARFNWNWIYPWQVLRNQQFNPLKQQLQMWCKNGWG